MQLRERAVCRRHCPHRRACWSPIHENDVDVLRMLVRPEPHRPHVIELVVGAELRRTGLSSKTGEREVCKPLLGSSLNNPLSHAFSRDLKRIRGYLYPLSPWLAPHADRRLDKKDSVCNRCVRARDFRHRHLHAVLTYRCVVCISKTPRVSEAFLLPRRCGYDVLCFSRKL